MKIHILEWRAVPPLSPPKFALFASDAVPIGMIEGEPNGTWVLRRAGAPVLFFGSLHDAADDLENRVLDQYAPEVAAGNLVAFTRMPKWTEEGST